MNNYFRPDWLINSAYDIEASDLKKHQIKAIIVDLDNTLLAWDEVDLSDRMQTWIHNLAQEEIQIFLLSNNNQSRVDKVVAQLQIPFMAKALKPSTRGFKKALKHFNLEMSYVAVIGDQILTDVIGAKRMGLKVILVKPLVTHDIIYTWVNRFIEKRLMKRLNIERHQDWGTSLD